MQWLKHFVGRTIGYDRVNRMRYFLRHPIIGSWGLFRSLLQAIGHDRINRMRYLLRHPVIGSWGLFRGLDACPWSLRNVLSQKKKKQCFAALESAGMRLLPYPAANIVGLVSDLDAAKPFDVNAYHTQLIRRHGLDFGDSFRLHQRASRRVRTEPLAFFDCDGCAPISHSYPHADDDRKVGFIELVREFHRGNLDHFHSLSAFGARVMVLNDVSSPGVGEWCIAVPAELERSRFGQLEFKSFRVPVCTVAVCTKGLELSDSATLVVVRPDGTELAYQRSNSKQREQYKIGRSRWKVAYFDVPLDRSREHNLFLSSIERIIVRDSAAKPATEVKALYLFNTDALKSHVLLESLRTEWNVGTNLVTDHASKYIVNTRVEREIHEAVSSRYGQSPLPSLYISGCKEDLKFSALGDHPDSIAYLLHYLVRTFGIKFINPSGQSGEPGERAHIFEITPLTQGRDRTRLFGARRMAPELPNDTVLDKKLENNMGTDTFSERMRRLLERSAQETDQAWPFYTHLGNTRNPQEPYFDDSVMSALQDRVMNISGSVPENKRLGFVSASRLYQYSLIAQVLPKHVSRIGGDTIQIKSWLNKHTGKTMPISVEDLYGITFYVDDNSKTQVCLDNKPIENLVRNPADGELRQSVTIVGGHVSHVLLDEVPFANELMLSQEECVAVQWLTDKTDAARGSGYAHVELSKPGSGRINWFPQDIDPAGCQHFAYSVRRQASQTRCGVLIETKDGGRFYFGDSVTHQSVADVNASYLTSQCESGEWERRVIPLVDLKWRSGSVPGGPLPVSPIASMSFILESDTACEVDLDAVEFLRSGSLRPAVPTTCVFGGRIEGAFSELRLVLSYNGPDGERIVRDDAFFDGSGFFAFTGLPRDEIVELYAESDGKRFDPSNGPLIAVHGDSLEVVIRKSEL